MIEEAIVELKRTATSDAAHQAEAFSNLGFLYMKQGKFADAIVCLQAALDIQPGDPTALRLLGYAFQEVGSFGKAYPCTEALDVQPMELSPYLYLAEIYGLRNMAARKKEMLGRFIHGLERGLDDLQETS